MPGAVFSRPRTRANVNLVALAVPGNILGVINQGSKQAQLLRNEPENNNDEIPHHRARDNGCYSEPHKIKAHHA